MRGIVLLCVADAEHKFYGEWAHNMALSIRAHSSLPIQVITDGTALERLPCENKVYDIITEIDFDDCHDKGLLPKFAPKVGGVVLPEDVKNHVHSWEEHLAMLHAGWNKCAIYGPDCPEWTEDQIQFEASADPVKAFGMGWKAYAISAPQKGDN